MFCIDAIPPRRQDPNAFVFNIYTAAVQAVGVRSHFLANIAQVSCDQEGG